MDSNDIFPTVIKFLELGYSMIPSGGGEKGKSPLYPWTEYQKRLPARRELDNWQFRDHPALWGWVTGSASGMVVLGSDSPKMTERLEALGIKPHIITPAGAHFLFRYPGHNVVTRAEILPKLDVRADGGFANCLGTRPDGGTYTIAVWPPRDTLYDWDILRKDLELWEVVNEGSAKARPTATGHEPGKRIFKGEGRNQALTREAGRLLRIYKEPAVVKPMIWAYNQAVCVPPLTEDENARTWEKSLDKWAMKDNHHESATTSETEYTPSPEQSQPHYQHKERTGIPAMKSLQDMREAIANDPEADDLIQDLLPNSNSAYMLIAGRSGIGKTFLLLNILYCLASGTPFMRRKTKKCKVGYLSLEGDRKKILKRFNAIGLSFPGAEDNIFWEHHMPFRLNSEGVDWLTAKVDGLSVVGIDPLRPLVPGDYTMPKDVSAFIENLRAVQDKTGVVVIGSHHIRKPDKRIKVQPEDLLFEIKGASEYVESATSVLLLERGQQERGEFGKFVTNTSLKNLHFVKMKDAPAEPVPLPLRFNDKTLLFEPVDELFGDET